VTRDTLHRVGHETFVAPAVETPEGWSWGNFIWYENSAQPVEDYLPSICYYVAQDYFIGALARRPPRHADCVEEHNSDGVPGFFCAYAPEAAELEDSEVE